jgi:putative membrane protein
LEEFDMLRAFTLTTILAMALVVPALAESKSEMAPAGATAPAARGNLFTETQARAHLSHLGYADISGLTKDENGVWRGTATKDGKSLTVAVDVKGAVVN